MNIIHAAALALFTFLSADAVTGVGVQHSSSANGPWTYTAVPGGVYYEPYDTIYAYNREASPITFNGWALGRPCEWWPAMAERTLQPNEGVYNTNSSRMLYAWCHAGQHPGVKCSIIGGGGTVRTCQ